MSRISQFLQKRLGMSASDATFSMQAYKTNVLIWECSCFRRWKPPSILGRIICRIRRSTRTQNSRRLKVCSTSLRSWWRNILKKLWMWNAWNIHHHHGRNQCWPMIKRSSGRRQTYVPTLIPFFVSEKAKDISGATARWTGQVKDLKKYSSYQDAVGIDGEATELEWKFSQDFHHCLFFKRSRKTWIEITSSTKSSRTESSSCQCSITLSGERMMRIAFRMPIKSRITRWNSRKDNWTFLGPGSEEKWNGNSSYAQKQKNGILQPTKWYSDSKKLVILYSKVSVPWSRGTLKQKKSKSAILFNENLMKTELLFQATHSVNQLNITEQWRIGVINSVWQKKKKRRVAVPVDNKILTMVEPQEVELLVSPPTQAPGKMVHGGALSFQILEKKVQRTQLCEKAFFQHLVIAGNYCKIRPNADDGWGRVTPPCREYSSSRSYPKTTALSPVPEGTIIGNGRANFSVDNKLLTRLQPEEVQLMVPPSTTAPGNRMRENVLSFEALASKIQLTPSCEKTNLFPISCDSSEEVQTSTWWLRWMGNNHSSMPGIHTFSIFENPKSWQLFPKAQSLDQCWLFKLWKFLMDMR